MTIDCAFIGRLGQDPELRTSAAASGPAAMARSTTCRFRCGGTYIECADGIAPDKKAVIGRNASVGLG